MAIAVKSISESLKIFRDALGMRLVRIGNVPTENVKTAFLQCGSLAIELLEPTKPDSTIGRFLERRGAGLHHLAVHVSSIEEAASRLKKSGLIFVDENPRAGAGKSRVAFIHPKSTGGVLIELVEK